MADRVWALDLDEQRRPVMAHLLVEHTEESRDGGVYVTSGRTACGSRFDPMVQGCWSTAGDEAPLQVRWIHCGLDAARIAEGDTDGR